MAQLPWFWTRVILRCAFGTIYKNSLVVGLVVFLCMAFHPFLYHFLALGEVFSTISKYMTSIQSLTSWSKGAKTKTETLEESLGIIFFLFLVNQMTKTPFCNGDKRGDGTSWHTEYLKYKCPHQQWIEMESSVLQYYWQSLSMLPMVVMMTVGLIIDKYNHYT